MGNGEGLLENRGCPQGKSGAACQDGIFYLIVLNVNTAIHHTEKEVAVVVFFDDTAEAGRVDEIGEMIRNRPEVTGTVYTSSEDAWNQFKDTYFEDKNLLEGVFEDDNPM